MLYFVAEAGIAHFVKRLQEAQHDFQGYCQSKRLDYLGLGALCEWCLIGSLLGSLSTVRNDLEAAISEDGPSPRSFAASPVSSPTSSAGSASGSSDHEEEEEEEEELE